MCLLIFPILVGNGSEIALAPCTLHRDMAALKCLYLQKYNECDYSQCQMKNMQATKQRTYICTHVYIERTHLPHDL